MIIQTRDFGELELNEGEAITFCSPIYGFEDLKKFALLYDDDLDGMFTWLQSMERADVCFILADPAATVPDYHPALQKADRAALGLSSGEEPVIRVVLAIPENARDATMNLKSPIAINPVKKLAAQVILEEDYPVRMRLAVDEEEASC